MAKVSDHLSVSALEERYKACSDATTARHVQAIWLLAQGHTAAQGVGHDGLRRALGPPVAGALQCRRSRCSGRFAAAERAVGHDPDACRARQAAGSPGRRTPRWRRVVERQGGGVSGRATRPGEGSGAARLGGASGGRLVAAAASTEEPEVRFGRGGGGFKKSSTKRSPRRPPRIPASRSTSSPRTNIVSA